MKQPDLRSKRRIRFSLTVIISQGLLIALAVAWGIYLVVISQNGGSIISTESNKAILYAEIVATGLIVLFSVVVIFMELNRLFARRRDDNRTESFRNQYETTEKPKLDKPANNPKSKLAQIRD
jgi:ABC-type nickel/cobalt efflux system permease component RcnA